MGMTRRDYFLIANAIRSQVDRRLHRDETDRAADPNMCGLTAAYMIARELCNRLAENNPMFDKVKFLKTCGVGYVRAKGVTQ